MYGGPPAWPPQPVDPDNPGWGVAAACLVWFASFLLLAIVPLLADVGYIITRINRVPADKLRELVLSDPHFVLVSVVAVIPAHLLTLWLVWWVVTGNARRSFAAALGWRWSRHFGWLEVGPCIGIVVCLLVINSIIAHYYGGSETALDKIIASSFATRVVVVVLATLSAPLVEEAVYRGVLYPALQRAIGKVWAVVIVAGLFAGVHAPQYRENLGVIMAIALLSLTLTLVRALTGRLLPGVIIHFLFNGASSVGILIDAHTKSPIQPTQTTGLLLKAAAHIAGLHF
jgi:uncharacterized protein